MKNIYLVILIAVVAVFMFLFEIIHNGRMRYKITSLQNQYERLLSENNNLLFKIDSMLSRENMDSFARKKRLSMPDEKFIIKIEI